MLLGGGLTAGACAGGADDTAGSGVTDSTAASPSTTKVKDGEAPAPPAGDWADGETTAPERGPGSSSLPPLRRQPPAGRLGDGSVQSFGNAADDGTYREAGETARRFYAAVLSRRWVDACSLLGTQLVDEIERLAGGAEDSCSDRLGRILGDQRTRPRETYDPQTRFTDLRVSADYGLLLLKAPVLKGGGFVPVVREDGEWRIAALRPTVF